MVVGDAGNVLVKVVGWAVRPGGGGGGGGGGAMVVWPGVGGGEGGGGMLIFIQAVALQPDLYTE